jgi:radical SAM superfamily enzyme YgiQ (UPF0313 family)
LPEVDLFIGTGEYDRLPGLIRHKLSGKADRTYVANPRFLPDHLTPRLQTTPPHTKYVKISEGCSHRCSFCVIPFMRGDLHSRQPLDVVSEIRAGVAAGVKEFNLVAQDLNEYGRDLTDRPSLYRLLKELESVDGDYWLRLMYMYPLQFPDKLVELIAMHPHVAKYVDIPLQHISDRMLKKMNRGSSSKYVHRLIEQLKKKVPGITLRTTFIVGHPGETEEDFKQLMDFIATSEFDRVGAFKFSPEEGTPSHDMTGTVPESHSSWTLGGKALPFEGMRLDLVNFQKPPYALRCAYEVPMSGNVNKEAVIKVENIDASILLVSGTDDQVWPSTLFGDLIIERLRRLGKDGRVKHLKYEHAGHGITVPHFPATLTEFGPVKLGGLPHENARAALESFEEVLKILSSL